MLNESFLHTPHGRLNLATGPSNGPVLVLLHGFTNRWQIFLPLLPFLLPDWTVVCFDHRGHGRSDRIDQPYTAAVFYEDAEAVLEYLQPAPVYLLGHSMGGSMALHLAQDHPGRVRAAVTGDTSLNLSIHIQVMNNRRSTKLFGLRQRMAGHSVAELLRRGLDINQAEELSMLDPRVMDFHAAGRVEAFFEGIRDVDFGLIRCPLLLTQANPERGGLLQDDEIPPVLAAYPQINFRRFDSAHDLEISRGMDSPFFAAALEFLCQVVPAE